MRKITDLVTDAFINGHKLTIGNSRTDGVTLYLHDNAIAWRDDDGLYISMAGWPTVTTRERLNGLLSKIAPRYHVVQRQGRQLLINDDLKLQVPLIMKHADIAYKVKEWGV